MKKAVAYLTPFMEAEKVPLHATSAGKILLATGHGPRRARTGALDAPARQPR